MDAVVWWEIDVRYLHERVCAVECLIVFFIQILVRQRHACACARVCLCV